MNQYFKIGKLVATFGLKGEIILQHHLGKKTTLKNLQTIFIENETDHFLPYFISYTKIKNESEIYIKLEEIDSKEAAKQLTTKEAWLSENDFKKYAAPSSPISLLGFTLINEDKGLGEIIEVIEQPHQILCTIIWNGKEILIPLHEQSLKKIDKKNRKVHVILPDGLLDIYQ